MIKRIIRYTAIALIWLLIWLLVSLAVGQELLFPSPISVIKRVCEFFASLDFYKTVGVSLLRVVLGMLIGVSAGVLGGILSASSHIIKDFFTPMLAVIKSTPVASFIILLVLWLSRDLTPVIIASVMVMPVVWANVETGIRETDKDLLEMSRVYGMSKAKRLTSIYIPSVYPYFLSSMRSSLGMAWKAGIAAEVLLQPLVSVGKQIFESKYMLETVDLFAWTVIVVILSIIIEFSLVILFKKAARRYSLDVSGGVKHG